MIDFILDNNLTDSSGKIDYNEAKEIANASNYGWNLTTIKISNVCNWIFEKPYKTKIETPPIIIEYNGNYEVLDGKTRLGYLNHLGKETAVVYLGNNE